MALGAIGVDAAKAWMTSLNDPLEDGIFSLLFAMNQGQPARSLPSLLTTAAELSTASGSTFFVIVICLVIAIAVATTVSIVTTLDDDEKGLSFRSPKLDQKPTSAIPPMSQQGVLGQAHVSRSPRTKEVHQSKSLMSSLAPTAEMLPSQTVAPAVATMPPANVQVGGSPMLPVQNPAFEPSMAHPAAVQQPSFMTARESSSPMPAQLQPTQATGMPLPPNVPPAGFMQQFMPSSSTATAALSAAPPLASATLAPSTTTPPSAVLRGPGSSASSASAPASVDLEIRGAIRPFKQQQLIEVFKAGTRSTALLRCYVSEFHAQGGILVEVPGKESIAFLDTTSKCVTSEGQPALPSPRSVVIKWAEPDRATDSGLPEEPFAVATEQLEHPGRIKLKRLNKDHAEGPELLQVLQYTPGSAYVSDPDGKLVATLKPDPRSEGMPPGEAWSLLSVSNLYSSYGGDVGLVLCAVIAACKIGTFSRGR